MAYLSIHYLCVAFAARRADSGIRPAGQVARVTFRGFRNWRLPARPGPPARSPRPARRGQWRPGALRRARRAGFAPTGRRACSGSCGVPARRWPGRRRAGCRRGSPWSSWTRSRPPRRSSAASPPRPRTSSPGRPVARGLRRRGGARVHRAQGLLARLDDDRVGRHDREDLVGHLDGHLAAAGLLRLLVAGARDLARSAASPAVRRGPRRVRRGPRKRPSSRPRGPRAAGGATRRGAAPPASRPAGARPRPPGCRASRARRPARPGGRGRSSRAW